MGEHRVEFVGLPSPYADPEVRYRLAMRQVRREKRGELVVLEGDRQRRGGCRFAGVTTRIVGHAADTFPDGTFREVSPSARPADPGERREGFGWTEDDRRYGRLADLAPDQVVVRDGRTYVAAAGWDRVYVFGPWDFVQTMTAADLGRLMAFPLNRRVFRDLEAPLILIAGAGGRLIAR